MATVTRFTQPVVSFRSVSFILVGIILFALSALPAQAQQPNWRATPTYDTISLSSGFSPDPQSHSVRAGGSTAIPFQGCSGYIHMDAPDMDLNYQSGSYPLSIEVQSDVDVTLLVYTPDGEWLCDDDSGSGTNARLEFDAPQSGNYNIWVGTYGSGGDTPSASVVFSELRGSQNASTSSASTTRNIGQSAPSSTRSSGTLNWQGTATYGTAQLSAGFWPDPHTTEVVAGGSIENPIQGNGCRGRLAANAPDVNLDYSAGSASLYIYTETDVDVTLTVRTPSGEWFCNDDGGEGLDAMIAFNRPQSGQYNIWVGAYSESDNYSTSRVHISEIQP
ncbi:MAG: hypothetical protein R6U20_08770 [Longimonas sp.]|uniref:hypothetical protein n=1 Tax=Longimonas sp. TaxID=2039626 RepID=UPI003976B6A9